MRENAKPRKPKAPKEKKKLKDSLPVKTLSFGFDVAHSAVGTALKVAGTLILILLISGLLFTCVFA